MKSYEQRAMLNKLLVHERIQSMKKFNNNLNIMVVGANELIAKVIRKHFYTADVTLATYSVDENENRKIRNILPKAKIVRISELYRLEPSYYSLIIFIEIDPSHYLYIGGGDISPSRPNRLRSRRIICTYSTEFSDRVEKMMYKFDYTEQQRIIVNDDYAGILGMISSISC